METYKEGFEAFSKGCETQAEETITAGTNAINKAIELLDEYNKALAELPLAVEAVFPVADEAAVQDDKQ